MAVEFIEEATGRDGSRDVDTNLKYRRTWVVRTSSPQDGASVVLSAPGIPTFNQVYSYLDDSGPGSPVTVFDNDAVVIDIRVSQDNPGDPQDWRVVVDYAGVEDPTAQPADVDYSPTRYQKSLVEDVAVPPRPVVNAAGDPFESGITVDRTRFTLTLVKAVNTWDPVAALAYQDSLNLSTFLATTHPPGFTQGTCKLTLGAKRMRRKGTTSFYWLRTAVIDIDREGWQPKVRNAGLNELVGGQKRHIMVDSGVRASSPQLLALDGRRLPVGGTPTTLTFTGYLTKDWTPLGLEY